MRIIAEFKLIVWIYKGCLPTTNIYVLIYFHKQTTPFETIRKNKQISALCSAAILRNKFWILLTADWDARERDTTQNGKRIG